MPYRPPDVLTDLSSDADSERTLTPRVSVKDLRDAARGHKTDKLPARGAEDGIRVGLCRADCPDAGHKSYPLSSNPFLPAFSSQSSSTLTVPEAQNERVASQLTRCPRPITPDDHDHTSGDEKVQSDQSRTFLREADEHTEEKLRFWEGHNGFLNLKARYVCRKKNTISLYYETPAMKKFKFYSLISLQQIWSISPPRGRQDLNAIPNPYLP